MDVFNKTTTITQKKTITKTRSITKAIQAAVPFFALFGGNAFASNRHFSASLSSRRLKQKSIVYVSDKVVNPPNVLIRKSNQSSNLDQPILKNTSVKQKSPFAAFSKKSVNKIQTTQLHNKNNAIDFLKNNDLLKAKASNQADISGDTDKSGRKGFAELFNFSKLTTDNGSFGATSTCNVPGGLGNYYNFKWQEVPAGCSITNSFISTFVPLTANSLSGCRAMHNSCRGHVAPLVNIPSLPVNFTEQAFPVQISASFIGDTSLALSDSQPEGWNGGTLRVRITANATLNDAISIATGIPTAATGILAIINGVNAGELYDNTTLIGSHNIPASGLITGGNPLDITFIYPPVIPLLRNQLNKSLNTPSNIPIIFAVPVPNINVSVTKVVRAIRYGNQSDAPSALPRTIDFIARDNTFLLGTGLNQATINVIPVNDPFTFSFIVPDATIIYTEDDPLKQVDPGAMVNDPDGDADWNGATITVSISSSITTNDEISIPDNLVNSINTTELNIFDGLTVIGTLNFPQGTITGANNLVVTLNANATNANVQKIIRALHFRNTSQNPASLPKSIGVNITQPLPIGNTVTGFRSLGVVPVNDAPTGINLSSTSINQSATGIGSTVGILSSLDVDDTSFTYSLITPVNNCTTGDDADNASFSISVSGSILSTTTTLAPGGYNVCLLTKDPSLDSFEQSFFINVVDDIAPTITGITIPNAPMKVGDTVTATISVVSDPDDYSLSSLSLNGTIDGYSMYNLQKINNTTYTALFDILDGGTNVAAGNTIAISVQLSDNAGNTTLPFETPIAQANDPIFANLPIFDLGVSTSAISEVAGIPQTSNFVTSITGSLNNQWPVPLTGDLIFTGTATLDIDYTTTVSSTTVPFSIAAGFSSVNTQVTGIPDNLYDALINETIIATINVVSEGNIISATSTKTIVVVDAQAAPIVDLSVGNSGLTENGGLTTTVTASLSNPTFEPVTVSLNYAGTATSGTDYNANASTTITIPAGLFSANTAIGITAVNDTIAEPSETIDISVTAVTGGSATENGVQQQIITIIDDDTTTVTLSTTASISETSPGNQATITANLSQATYAPVVVDLDYLATSTATQTTDYINIPTSITIPMGSTTASVTFDAVADLLVEGDESVDIDILSVSGGNSVFTPSIQSTTIIDSTSQVSLSVSANTISENSGTSTITATLDQAQSVAVDVNLAYSGSATNIADYNRPAFITIPANTLAATADITAIVDALIEGNETIGIDISGTTGGFVVVNSTPQTVTITDATAVLTLSIDKPIINEGGSVDPFSTITATLNQAATSNITVNLQYSGSATNSADYVAVTTIDIVQGDTIGTASVIGLADNVVEFEETVLIDVLSITDGGIAVNNVADNSVQQTVTIHNNNISKVLISRDNATIPETGGVATITATLDLAAPTVVTVDLAFSSIAIFGVDYNASDLSIIIPAGMLSGTSTITTIDDNIAEFDESLIAEVMNVTSIGNLAVHDITGQSITQVTILRDDVSNIVLSASNVSILEAGGTSDIIATLDNPIAFDVDINLAYDNFAIGGIDYNNPSSVITILAGNLVGTASVGIIATDDNLVEGPESLRVRIVSDNALGLIPFAGFNGIEFVTIVDNDTALVTLSCDTPTISEASGQALCNVNLTNPVGQVTDIELSYSGTAQLSGVDANIANTNMFPINNFTLTLVDGQSTAAFPIEITAVDDMLVEMNETIIVDVNSISGPAGITENGIQQQIVTIIDNDSSKVSLSTSPAIIVENAGISTITATIDQVSFSDITVNLLYSGTATNVADYTKTDTITITAGNTTGSTTVTAVQDIAIEGDETIVIDIDTVTGGPAIEDAVQQQTITISDDETVNVSFNASLLSIAEAAGSTVLTVSVNIPTFEDVMVSLDYTTGFVGAATAGVDFNNITSITIPAGMTSASVTLTAIQDTLAEGNEFIVINVSNVTGGNAFETGFQQATISIIDDESVTVSMTSNNTVLDEISGTSDITVSLSQASLVPIQVEFEFSGTATEVDDYILTTPINRSLENNLIQNAHAIINFPPGTISVTRTISVIPDNSPEADETIIVDIVHIVGGGATENGIQQQTLTITDDDNVQVDLSVSSNNINENAGLSTITVSLDQPTYENVTVELVYSGTANNADFNALITLLIPQGLTQASTNLTATQDTLVEGPEQIIVDVSTITGGSALENGIQQQSIFITDDEVVNVTLSVNPTTIDEVGGASTITATLDQVTNADVTVNLVYSGSAASSDYVVANSIVVPQGSTSASIILNAVEDLIVEANESVIIDIDSVSGGNAFENGVQQQTIIIMDDAFFIGGLVTGLHGINPMVLQNNAGDDLTIVKDGAFVFDTPLLDNQTYDVSIQNQPESPIQTCAIASGTGTVNNADVSSIEINCETGDDFVFGSGFE